jgi:hypothetical protein
MQEDAVKHQIITDTAELSALCARVASAPFVTVDTEFMRENTFWAQLCLIQMASPDEAAIIDPLADKLDLKSSSSRPTPFPTRSSIRRSRRWSAATATR